jgi:hypothetical protein
LEVTYNQRDKIASMTGLPPLPPECQQARCDALASIGRHLASLGEPAWHDVVAEWLRHYDGLEAYLYPEEDPVVLVLAVLQQYSAQGRSLTPEGLARDIAALPFVGLAARRGAHGPRWNPLAEQFRTWTEGDLVDVWEALEPGTIRDMTQTRLLVQFAKVSQTQTR